MAEGNDTYASQDGVLFSKDLTTLVRYPSGRSGAYIIPDGTETIAQVAFYDQQLLSELTIPDSVTTIENIAFAGNTALTTVNLSCFKSDLASNFDSSVLNYIHSWNYTANGATIISTCSDCDTQQTLTIVEPTLTTYGGAGNAKQPSQARLMALIHLQSKSNTQAVTLHLMLLRQTQAHTPQA